MLSFIITGSTGAKTGKGFLHPALLNIIMKLFLRNRLDRKVASVSVQPRNNHTPNWFASAVMKIFKKKGVL